MRTEPFDLNAAELRAAIVSAWGGAERWRRARRIQAALHTGGWAFRMRGRGAVRNVRATLDVHSFHVELADFPGPGRSAEVGRDFLRVDGREERPRSTNLLRSGRRRLYWDAGDFAYFVGYAIWNYLTLPALLLRDDIRWATAAPLHLQKSAQVHTILRGHFPSEIPTHCATQDFYFDSTARLARHDYTAEAFGDFACAANIVDALDCADGFQWVRRRAVHPRAAYERGVNGPTLVDVEVPEFRVIST